MTDSLLLNFYKKATCPWTVLNPMRKTQTALPGRHDTASKSTRALETSKEIVPGHVRTTKGNFSSTGPDVWDFRPHPSRKKGTRKGGKLIKGRQKWGNENYTKRNTKWRENDNETQVRKQQNKGVGREKCTIWLCDSQLDVRVGRSVRHVG